jgi:cell wall-associated NlpC family hydrolase
MRAMTAFRSLARAISRLAALVLAGALSAACASSRFGPPVPEGYEPPAGTPIEAPHAATPASDVLLHAVSLMGTRYKFGGSSVENGFDCSGFVHHVFAQAASVTLPRSSREQAGAGRAVRDGDLKPGDLVFYNTRRAPFSHVGIYMGEGKFIHAPSRGKHVEIVNMGDRYWQSRFNGARRVLPG